MRGKLRGEGTNAIRDDPAAAAAQGTIAATARSDEGRITSLVFSILIFL